MGHGSQKCPLLYKPLNDKKTSEINRIQSYKMRRHNNISHNLHVDSKMDLPKHIYTSQIQAVFDKEITRKPSRQEEV